MPPLPTLHSINKRSRISRSQPFVPSSIPSRNTLRIGAYWRRLGVRSAPIADALTAPLPTSNVARITHCHARTPVALFIIVIVGWQRLVGRRSRRSRGNARNAQGAPWAAPAEPSMLRLTRHGEPLLAGTAPAGLTH